MALRAAAGRVGTAGGAWPVGDLLPLAVAALAGFRADHGILPAVGPIGRGRSVLDPRAHVQRQRPLQGNQALDDLIRDAAPDIVALQGCWHQARVKWPAGWQVVQGGELLIASRYPLRDVRTWQQANRTGILSCIVATPERDLRFATLHPQSPHQSFDQILDRRTILRLSGRGPITDDIEDRRQDAEQAAAWLEDGREPRITVGDFNLPPDSAIYRMYWSEYCNAFGKAGLGFGYTEWPRMRRAWFGIRIDHILSTADWQPRRCWVGPDVGSDHLPLIADLYPAK